jgi:hypothetical protein
MIHHYGTLWWSTRSGVEFILNFFLWIVESEEESKHTVVFYMCLSVVLRKEKLWRVLLHSYDGIGDSHFVAIYRIENVGGKGFFQRFPHALASIKTSGVSRSWRETS